MATIKKVYILGEARGAYRTQNLVKFFLDRQSEYKICYNTFQVNNLVLRYLKSIFVNFWTILQSDIIYVSTLNVDVNIFWELFLAKIFRKHIIIDYYVSVFDTVVLDRKWFKENSILAKVAIKMDRFFIKVGSNVIFLNKTEKNRYCKLASIVSEQDKFKIIPLCVDEVKEIKSGFVYGEKEKLTICWWGSYLPLHGVNNLLEAASILQRKNINVEWYFFGNSKEKGAPYRKQAEDLHLDNCVFIDDYTFKNGKLLSFLKKNCDLALGNFGESEKSKNVLINKILDASAMKVNLLTGYSNAVSEFFDGDENIFMCESNPENISKKIEEIFYTDKKNLMKRIVNSYQIYLKTFSVNAYVSCIEELLKGSKNEKKVV